MKTKLTLFVAVIAIALFGTGCASTSGGKIPELKGEVWTGYFTELDTIYTIRMWKQKDEFAVYFWKADNTPGAAGAARWYLKEIKSDGQIIFSQDSSQTNNSKTEYIGTIVDDGARIVNGFRTMDGERGYNKWELIRAESKGRPRNE